MISKDITVVPGTSLTWSVSAEGFITQSGIVENIQADTVLPTIYLLGNMSGIKKAFFTDSTSWYIDLDDNLYGCGANDLGQQGSGTSGSGTNVTTFTKRAENVKDIYADNNSTWYIDNNGDLYGCGANNYGQQGSGTSGSGTNVLTFTKRASNVAKVKTYGSTTWYITTSGYLYGCGMNDFGQQGQNSSTIAITTFTNRASSVADVFPTGRTTWYLKSNGDLYGCGMNNYGQQGSGNTNNVTTFTKRASNVSKCSFDAFSSWYITSSGDLYGCGEGSSGQQGSGNTNNVTTFTKRANNVKEISIGGSYAVYLTESGYLYTAGSNYYGQQGTTDTSSVKTFTLRKTGVKSIFANNNHTWYIDNNSDLYGTGTNYYGEQSSGTSGYDATIRTFTKRASNIKEILYANSVTWYMDESNNVYGCGFNSNGQQSSGDTNDVTTFTKRLETLINTASITISPNPTDATVVINSEAVSSADVRKGMPVEWSVSKEGYVTQTGTIDHIYEDTDLNIELEVE